MLKQYYFSFKLDKEKRKDKKKDKEKKGQHKKHQDEEKDQIEESEEDDKTQKGDYFIFITNLIYMFTSFSIVMLIFMEPQKDILIIIFIFRKGQSKKENQERQKREGFVQQSKNFKSQR